MVKVKYNGDQGIRLHKIDFYPGDIKEVADGLAFPKEEFEVLSEEKIEKKVSKAPAKKASKKADKEE